MKSGGGDFSPEAYELLREAYDKEQQRQVDDEIAGTKLMGQKYGLETLPVDSPWADKIDLWKYPDGKQPYTDKKQSPDEILQIMRDAAQERVEAKKEEDVIGGLDDLSDEEFDAEIDKIVADAGVDDEDGDEEEEDDDEVEEEESEAEEAEEAEEEETETEDESEELVVRDAEDVAAKIAELRSQIESMQFVSEPTEEEETTEE